MNIAPPQPDGWKQPCTPVAMRADISPQNPQVWVLEVMWVADGADFTRQAEIICENLGENDDWIYGIKNS